MKSYFCEVIVAVNEINTNNTLRYQKQKEVDKSTFLLIKRVESKKCGFITLRNTSKKVPKRLVQVRIKKINFQNLKFLKNLLVHVSSE